MQEENDGAYSYVIGEQGEEYQRGCYKVMKKKLIIFSICFPPDGDDFEDGEEVNSELNHVEYFYFV